MAVAKRIYNRLPLALKWGAIQYVGGKKSRIRGGGVFSDFLRLLRETENWSTEEIRVYQAAELVRLLLEVRRHVPYYRDSLASFRTEDLDQIGTSLDVERLPLLSKSDRRERSPDFLNETRKTALVSPTSGTTGSPLQVHKDAESAQRMWAILVRHREWAGAQRGQPNVRLSGNVIVPASRSKPPFWVLNHSENQLLVSSHHLNREYLPVIWEKLEKFDPVIIDGYPSAAVAVARYSATVGRRLPSLRAVITTAELLAADVRETIEAALGVKVLDYYSASEGIPIVQQDLDGAYYVRPESGIIEILGSDGRPTAPGEIGEIVATSFVQWRTPLIRYRTGDVAYVAAAEERQTAERTNFQILGGIGGRFDDLVCTRDGRLFGLFNGRIMKYIERGIADSQIIQKTPEQFEIRAVLSGERSRADLEAEITRLFVPLFGYTPEVELKAVDYIPRGPNGKYRTTIRLFPIDEYIRTR